MLFPISRCKAQLVEMIAQLMACCGCKLSLVLQGLGNKSSSLRECPKRWSSFLCAFFLVSYIFQRYVGDISNNMTRDKRHLGINTFIHVMLTNTTITPNIPCWPVLDVHPKFLILGVDRKDLSFEQCTNSLDHAHSFRCFVTSTRSCSPLPWAVSTSAVWGLVQIRSISE